MIISHKYKFIFIKTLKTAGTSIETFLSQHCGDEDIVTPIYPHVAGHEARNHKGIWNPIPDFLDEHNRGVRRELKDFLHLKKFYNHIPARIIRRRLPDQIWDSYFKFCVERNPWDKTLSHYFMMRDRTDATLTIDQYLDKGDYCLNLPKYSDSSGKLIVDHVVKYEHLNSELNEIFLNLGIPFSGTLGIKAKSEHRPGSKTGHQHTLNEQQKTIIGEVFAEEISIHKYGY